jgi:hypothetical protein
MFVVLFALSFSLAVCAGIGVGVTTGFGRLRAYVRAARQRVLKKRSDQEA